MSDLISRQAAIDAIFGRSHEIIKMRIGNLPSAPTVEERPTGRWMSFEEVAEMLTNLFGECACDVNGNDEWLPQSCKYAETECPSPKEKNGCWMQFLIQGGADMRGDTNE